MAIRFDRGSTIATLKPHITEDGTLLAEAVFARDGVLEYRDGVTGKVRRELRPAEENHKALTDFGLSPVTTEHPPGLLTEDNAADYRHGLSLQNVRHTTDRKGGFVQGAIAVFDSNLKSLILSGKKVETSTGYRCDVDETPGVWTAPDGSQHRYDAIQKNIRVNHIAVTEQGRAGPDVRIHTDSFDEPVAYQIDSIALPTTPQEKRRMATLRIDSAEYTDIPEAVASVMSSKLTELEKLTKLDSDRADQIKSLNETATRSDARADAAETRADATEYVLSNAEEILESLGYKRDSEGEYRQDLEGQKNMKKGGKMAEADDEEEDAEDGGDDEAAEGEADEPAGKKKMPWMMGKGKGKSTKKDSVRVDAKTIVAAWREADKLVAPNDEGVSFSDQHFDSAGDDITAIQKLVVQALRPKMKLDSKTADQIAIVYEMVKEDAAEAATQETPANGSDRQDASPNYVAGLSAAVAGARGHARSQQMPKDQPKQDEKPAYLEPLALSRA